MLLRDVSCIMSSGQMYVYWSPDVFGFGQLLHGEENLMTIMLNFPSSGLLIPVTNELELISLSQQGDAEAFARLYACYVERITRYVYSRVTDQQLAEDITSRIFLKMLEKLDTYQVGQSPLIA